MQAVLSAFERRPSTLFAEGVLIPPVSPGLHLPPRLRPKKPLEFVWPHYPRPARLAITISEVGNPGQKPHRKQRDRRPKRVPGLCNETASPGSQDPVHLGNGPTPIREHGKQPGRYQDIETVVSVGKLEDIVALKPAILQSQTVPFLPRP